MRRLITGLMLSSALAWTGTPAHAQDEVIEARVLAYFEKLKASDWVGAANEFSPRAQKQFRRMFQEIIEAAPKEERSQARAAFMGESMTSEQVAKLSDRDYMGKVMTNLFGRALKMVAFKDVRILGVVHEGDDMAHVVTRAKLEGPDDLAVEKIVVTSVEGSGKEWGLALTGEIEGAASAIRAQLRRRQAAAEGTPQGSTPP